jgi:hypothetical protein
VLFEIVRAVNDSRDLLVEIVRIVTLNFSATPARTAKVAFHSGIIETSIDLFRSADT